MGRRDITPSLYLMMEVMIMMDDDDGAIHIFETLHDENIWWRKHPTLLEHHCCFRRVSCAVTLRPARSFGHFISCLSQVGHRGTCIDISILPLSRTFGELCTGPQLCQIPFSILRSLFSVFLVEPPPFFHPRPFLPCSWSAEKYLSRLENCHISPLLRGLKPSEEK